MIGPVGGTVIIRNTAHARARVESDVMHELAHVLCKHEPVQFQHVQGFPFPLRGHDLVQKGEATWLGACLQVPRTALWWAIKVGMDEAQMAQHFGASQAMIRFRRQVTAVDLQFMRVSAKRQPRIRS
jgi:Zn-dependent peptidase ImmA (M78 family)